MNTREYLNQIQRYDRVIRNKYVELEQLEAHAIGLSSFSYGDRVQTSGSQDKIGDLVAKIVDLQSEIADTTNEYLKEKAKVIKTIDSVKNSVLYDILFKKYVEGKTLDIIESISKNRQHRCYGRFISRTRLRKSGKLVIEQYILFRNPAHRENYH